MQRGRPPVCNAGCLSAYDAGGLCPPVCSSGCLSAYNAGGFCAEAGRAVTRRAAVTCVARARRSRAKAGAPLGNGTLDDLCDAQITALEPPRVVLAASFAKDRLVAGALPQCEDTGSA